jgi:hypothetical protein
MAHVNARQWQRYSYRADVQLRWTAAESERDVQGGVCVNLGRGGMQVRADTAPEVGAAVSCRLFCAGEWTTLPGRVRWRKTQPQPELANDVGIEFGPLSAEQSDSVCELVATAEHGGQPVKLRVPALRDPLEALAVPTDRGLRLRAPLRLFVPGSELEVEHSDPALQVAGRVVSAQLCPRAGTEHWELELLIEAREAPRGRRYAIYESPSARFIAQSDAAKRRARAETLMMPGVGRPRAAPWLLGALLLAAAVLGVGKWLLTAAGRPSQHLAVSVQAETPQARVQAKALEPRVTAVQRPMGIASVAVAPVAAVPVAVAPKVAATPLTSATSNAGESAAPQDDAPPTFGAEYQYIGDEPTLRVSGDTSEIFVPARGSLDDLHTALWVEPLALVVELPAAEVTLPRSRYALRAGGVKLLSISESRGVTQLRLFLDALLARYSTQAVAGGLLIRLKRDLRPLP